MRQDLQKIADAFLGQQKWCIELGSPLTAYICEQAAKHISTNNLLADIMLDFADNMRGSAAPLRFTGAINSLVLQGKAPNLQSWYKHGFEDYAQLWPQIEQLIEGNFAFFKQFVTEAPQTNEVGRSAILLAAFSEISKQISQPVALYELGASAGLNLFFDKFQYDLKGQKWGDENAQVKLAPNWLGNDINLDFELEIAARNGCDLNALNVNDDADLLSLRSYIWPDMAVRQQRFEAAVKITQKHGVSVDNMDAVAWLKDKLQNLKDGQAHVIFHTIAWQYFPENVKAELEEMIENTGASATITKPLVHLSFEFNYATGADFSYRIWNGENLNGTSFALGKAHPHGAEIEWLA